MSARDRDEETGAVRTGLALSAALCLVELVGGLATNSLALVTDAVHMLTDVAALALTWFALWIGARPATAQKTYGYYRAEILAAFVNGVVLSVLVVFVLVEAWRRLHAPAEVVAGPMLAVATAGFLVNVFVATRLHAHQGASLSLRGAYLHVASDLLGSVGAMVAGVVILLTGWSMADALASFAISALILRSAWTLVREAIDVLMEAVPPHVDLDALQRALEGVPGVDEVHDLHAWTLTTGRYALSAHAVACGDVGHDALLASLTSVCSGSFGIDHVTIQIERENRRAAEPPH